MMKKRILLIGIMLSFLAAPVIAEDDFQYWSQYSFKIIDGKKIDLTTFADIRFKEDATKAGLYYVSERLKFDFWKNLSLGANYTYLNSRKTDPIAADTDYKFQHRLEAEITPHWEVSDRFKIDIRNRMEFRWIEDKGSYNTRYRQRWTFDYPIKSDSIFKSVFISSEFFYNMAEHEYNENRSIPIGFTFKLSEKVSTKVYYMVQSNKEDDWSSSQILGTLVSVVF